MKKMVIVKVLRNFFILLFICLLLNSCSFKSQEEAEGIKVKEIEAVKEIKVEGNSKDSRSYLPAGSMFISSNQKGENGKVFLQTLGEENTQNSLVGVEQFVPNLRNEVYIIDHPPAIFGARVQKFSFPSGKLKLVKKLEPSTLFTIHRKGFFVYHHPPGIVSPEGQVIIEDEKGKVLEKMVVPSNINVGAIFSDDNDVWVLQEGYSSSPFPFKGEVPVAYYYPALIGLKTQKKIEANYLGWDGNFYFFGTREVNALTVKPAKGSYFLFGPIREGKPAKKMIFPWEVKLVGVDKKGNVYVLRDRELSFEPDSENNSEFTKAPRFLYRVSPQGKITHFLNLGLWFEPQMYKKIYVWVGPEGEVWSLLESPQGVEIRKFISS